MAEAALEAHLAAAQEDLGLDDLGARGRPAPLRSSRREGAAQGAAGADLERRLPLGRTSAAAQGDLAGERPVHGKGQVKRPGEIRGRPGNEPHATLHAVVHSELAGLEASVDEQGALPSAQQERARLERVHRERARGAGFAPGDTAPTELAAGEAAFENGGLQASPPVSTEHSRAREAHDLRFDRAQSETQPTHEAVRRDEVGALRVEAQVGEVFAGDPAIEPCLQARRAQLRGLDALITGLGRPGESARERGALIGTGSELDLRSARDLPRAAMRPGELEVTGRTGAHSWQPPAEHDRHDPLRVHPLYMPLEPNRPVRGRGGHVYLQLRGASEGFHGEGRESEAVAVPGEVARIGRYGESVEGPVLALRVPCDLDLGALEANGRVDGCVARQAEAGTHDVAIENAQVDGAGERHFAPGGSAEANLALRLEVHLGRMNAPRLEDKPAAHEHERHLARHLERGGVAEAQAARAEGEAAGQGAIAAHVETALEIRQVHFHGHTLVVEQDQAPLHDQAVEPDRCPRGVPTAQRGQIVAAFLEGIDAHPRRLEAKLAQSDTSFPRLGEARHGHDPGDLEEGRGVGAGAGHAQTVDLRGGGPGVQGNVAHRRLAFEESGEAFGQKLTREEDAQADQGEKEDESQEKEDQEPAARSHGHSRLPVPWAALLQDDEQRSGLDRLTLADRHLADARGPRRFELVFHLHGFHDHEALPRLDKIARRDLDPQDPTGHGRHHANRPRRQFPLDGALPARGHGEVYRDHVVREHDGETRGALLQTSFVAAPRDEQAHEIAASVEKVHLEGPAVDGHGVPPVLAADLDAQGTSIDHGVEEHARAGRAGLRKCLPATTTSRRHPGPRG